MPQATVAVAFAVLLLVLATTSQGAFAISRWAPLALFTLAVLIGAVLTRRGKMIRSGPVRVAVAAIWGLAGWSLLSMLWAQSAGNAFEASGRMILYAAIATLPLVLPLSRRTLAAAGWSITIGICAIAVYVLIRLLVNGMPLFLAGRLNGPVNYRNATALLFALPFWPLVIAAATRGNLRGVRAASLAAATLCLGLAFETQSRGILLGLAVGACLALLVGPDRVRRAWIAALAVAGVAIASPELLRPFHAFDGGAGLVSSHDIAVAARALLVLTVAAFVVGLAIALFESGLRANSVQMRYLRRAARIALAVGAIAVVVVGLAAIGNPISYAQRKWDEFRSLKSTTPTTTRLLSVGGQRYDLWRVAVKEFEGAPVSGVGSDNYEFDYYRYRRTDRNLNDPHSLVFALLSENGLVGVALFVTFLGGLGVTLRRGWRTLEKDEKRHAIAPAAAGAVLLGQATVDWIWLIPGLSAIGLLALSIAAAQIAAGREAPLAEPDLAFPETTHPAFPETTHPAFPETTHPAFPETSEGNSGVKQPGTALVLRRHVAPEPVPRWARAVRPAAIGGLLLAVISVLALFLSDAYIQQARSVIYHPSAELSAAQTASALNPWSVTAHYLQASAYESSGDRLKAYQQLRDALSLEPQNFATLGVLGDFEARRGNDGAARSYYRQALALDPRDYGLQLLARGGGLRRRQ